MQPEGFMVEGKDVFPHGLLLSRNRFWLLPWPQWTWEGIETGRP